MPSEPQSEVLAYIAGIIDGEGSIGFTRQHRGNKRLIPRVLIVNSELSILQFVQRFFGGDIQPMKRAKEHWKPTWQWRLSGTRAVDFLSAIQPWVIAKRDQIVLVFAWDATHPGRGRISEARRIECAETQDFLADCMHFQNHRGVQTRPDPLDIALAEMGDSPCH
jgi:hypothetical protein